MASEHGQPKIAAILAADVVGFSRLTGMDEDRTLARLRALRSDVIDPTIAVHHGRVVKRTGDGLIIEFRSVVDAVRCAIEVLSAMSERNAGVGPDKRNELRIGVHLGDVVEESDGDLVADGVNIAARLEGICEPTGVCLSSAAYDQVRDRVNETFVDLGDKELKNIAGPVRVYAVKSAPSGSETSSGHSPVDSPDPLRASIAVLRFTNMSGDVQSGINIVLRALEAPIRQIAENSGVEGSIVVGKVLENKSQTYGFDAQTEQYVDMLNAGIVDPAKVVRVALQDAASISGLMITTEAMVAETPEEGGSGRAGRRYGRNGWHGLLISSMSGTGPPPRGSEALRPIGLDTSPLHSGSTARVGYCVRPPSGTDLANDAIRD